MPLRVVVFTFILEKSGFFFFIFFNVCMVYWVCKISASDTLRYF